MKKALAFIFLFFVSTGVYCDDEERLTKEIQAKIEKEVERLNLVFDTHVMYDAVYGSTLVSYANRITKTEYSLKEGCSYILYRCEQWRKTLLVLVKDNKQAMRDYYLGCKLAYHALSQKDADEEIPDDVLVACYGESIIPEKTPLRFARKLFLN